MIALVAIAVTAVGWLSYRNLEQAILPRVLDRIETHSRFVANELESHVRGVRGDIATFHGLAAVAGLMRAGANGGIDPTDGTTEAVWRERLEGRLAGQMGLKPAYSLRFIGVEDGHREIVRVDRSGANGAVRIVPKTALKQVGDAPYFRKTIKLAPGEVYVSPVDLNAASSRRRACRRCGSRCRYFRRRESLSASSSSIPTCGLRLTASGPRLERAKSSTRSTPGATTLFIPTVAVNSVRSWARRPIGQATFPIWPRPLARRQASRTSPPTRQDDRTASRLPRRCSPAANGSPSSKSRRMRPSWDRRPRSGTAQ